MILLWFLLLVPSFWSAPKILCLGDSLTEGYGIETHQAWPALLEAGLKEKGLLDVEIINAGVSGAVSASGLSRLRWSLKAGPDLVFIALGANDGLRGLPTGQMERNLDVLLQEAIKILGDPQKVIFAGMKVPPNYGLEYSRHFEEVYLKLADKYQIHFVPFLLEDVAGDKTLNLPDGIHPNAQGHQIIMSKLLPTFLKALKHVDLK